MRRYKFLSKDSVYTALNKLRAAFLAAKDNEEVDQIIKGVLTHDERMKIGRRIQIVETIKTGLTYRDIKKRLKVGVNTIMLMDRKLQQDPKCFNLITYREEKVEREYKRKAYEKVGGPKMVFKKKVYTGFKRKNIKR